MPNSMLEPTRKIAGQTIKSVKEYGAVGDGKADDTVAINKAIKAVYDAGGGTIIVPYGAYLINMITQIDMMSRCHLKVHPLAELLGKPNAEPRYQMVNLRNCEDFIISGGIFRGDRDKHNYSASGTHEWGHCFAVYGAKRGNIIGTTATNFTGDGLSVGRNESVRSDDIWIAGNIFTRNRRQGISVVTGDNVTIIDNECSWTGDTMEGAANGTEPMCGIDIEPERDAGPVKNIQVINNRLCYNKRYGLLLERRSNDNGGADIFDTIVDGNEIYGNFSNGSEIKSATRTVYKGNHVHDNSATGVVLNGDIQSHLEDNRFGKNYYRNGIKPQMPPFTLVGTNSKTERDILKKNSSTATFGPNYFY